jgi:hypothetical protein
VTIFAEVIFFIIFGEKIENVILLTFFETYLSTGSTRSISFSSVVVSLVSSLVSVLVDYFTSSLTSSTFFSSVSFSSTRLKNPPDFWYPKNLRFFWFY